MVIIGVITTTRVIGRATAMKVPFLLPENGVYKCEEIRRGVILREVEAIALPWVVRLSGRKTGDSGGGGGGGSGKGERESGDSMKE